MIASIQNLNILMQLLVILLNSQHYTQTQTKEKYMNSVTKKVSLIGHGLLIGISAFVTIVVLTSIL